MGSLLEKRERALRHGDSFGPPTLDGERRRTGDEILFQPARRLVVLVAVARAVLRGGRITKLGVLGLIWSFTPRAVKIAAAGVAAAAMIITVGALAAIALLALQLS
jgi:hypothetical protein